MLNGDICYEVQMICPELAEVENAVLKVREPETSQVHGTIVLLSGGLGRGPGGNHEHSGKVMSELKTAGFLTVQVLWKQGWLKGASGQFEDPARLASRPATILRWIYDNLHSQDKDCTFCATDNSGGAMQLAYTLAHYGQADIFDAVVLTGGPPTRRIDLGCDRNNKQFWCGEYIAARYHDVSFGFLADSSGPCASSDYSFLELFKDASISVDDWDYVYPKTMVWFLFGENDIPTWVANGMTYYERLIQEGSPLVRVDTVSNTPYIVHNTKEGAEKIRDILLTKCKCR
jgi:hypothetical protein